eukprot:CAMPEP_0202767320 /NCGR_PEP_ID=MMETSP1388-20130828/32522_1 /ASSEMBLY_ACC=CAM_ASM_000864 /TAXON_ID=37098 /ORGANISM="Isochrysis sp, Strain CCMP1244" /LENGTH=31 /DNA_ID= /DNA_START= /DNA_END= /DNA_ORIENTATION=
MHPVELRAASLFTPPAVSRRLDHVPGAAVAA